MQINDPRELALDLVSRSTCRVKVAAVIWDAWGVVSWGWNHAGDGFGQCAEHHALTRANAKRLRGAAIAIAARRGNKTILSRPCQKCWSRLKKKKLKAAFYTNHEGNWNGEPIT